VANPIMPLQPVVVVVVVVVVVACDLRSRNFESSPNMMIEMESFLGERGRLFVAGFCFGRREFPTKKSFNNLYALIPENSKLGSLSPLNQRSAFDQARRKMDKENVVIGHLMVLLHS
jgi:hypothetical protein